MCIQNKVLCTFPLQLDIDYRLFKTVWHPLLYRKTGINMDIDISLNNECGYSLEPPQIYVLSQIKKKINIKYFNSDPLKPHFYIVTLGFTGVFVLFML